jgi:tetratricopeptide (TPR) repeat protein
MSATRSYIIVPHVAQVLNNLANTYYDKGEHAKAEPLFDRALAIREKTFGPESADVAATLTMASPPGRPTAHRVTFFPTHDRC